MRTRSFSLLAAFFLALTMSGLHAQLKVVSALDGSGLEQVSIRSKNDSLVGFTDLEGFFTLSRSGPYLFSKEGYTSKVSQIEAGQFITVLLDPETENLGEIIIRTSNFQTRLKTYDGAISVIPDKVLNQYNAVSLAPILNTTSGVFMQNGTLNTNKITIRGIGSRTVFGTSKIRAYYQDIPLTNGSGESTVEDIEIKALGSMEISKGPSSSRYGAGLGGTIQLIPDSGSFGDKSLQGGLLFGSFGLQKYWLQTSLGNQNNSANLLYSDTHSDGYRQNNEFDRKVLTFGSQHKPGENNTIFLIGNYIDQKAYIPSSVDEDTYKNNPEAAARNWSEAAGYEDYQKGLFGLSWEHTYSEKSSHYISLFGSFLDSYEPRPFNILDEKTKAYGLRARFASKAKIANKTLQWTLGGELFSDQNSYQTYQNLYRNYPPGTGSVQGDLLSDLKENRAYFNLFLDTEYPIFEKTKMTFGVNYNQTSYKLDDRYSVDDSDQSGDYQFDPIVSPKFGITYELNDLLAVYGVISHGFSPPTLEETLLPNGEINTDIKPESGWNYEVGTRGKILKGRLFFDAALFTMTVKDLLVPQRTGEDEFVGINAGETKYKGLEFSFNYYLLKSEKITLSIPGSLTYNDFKFTDFQVLEADYSGNELTGVPQFLFYSGINTETRSGIFFFVNYNYVSEMPMRDDNTVYSDAYGLLNLKLGFKSPITKRFHYELYFGINNITDEKYASMILINAVGIGNTGPRYYYPGEPVNYYAGFNLKYLL